jgi:anti-sigma28 factor (negative regulator of flagellin synthesis)
MTIAAKTQKTPTVKQMVRNVTEMPEVRQELVDKFRFLIQTGRYQVSNRAIAEAMLGDGVFGGQDEITAGA